MNLNQKRKTRRKRRRINREKKNLMTRNMKITKNRSKNQMSKDRGKIQTMIGDHNLMNLKTSILTSINLNNFTKEGKTKRN